MYICINQFQRPINNKKKKNSEINLGGGKNNIEKKLHKNDFCAKFPKK